MKKIRVAIYGCGRWANRTHIPNLLKIKDVDIAAVCDTNQERLQATAARFNIPATYRDGREMLNREEVDVLFSVIPAYAREESEVEVLACQQGIHLFCEKPQALTMRTAHRMNNAVQASGVLSTVGFRERYRPLFQEAKQHLRDKDVVHIHFQLIGNLPGILPPDRGGWKHDIEKQGGLGLNWGVHAVDYVRFCTGLDIVQAQAFYLKRDKYPTYLSQSFHYRMSNGAPMNQTFIHATDAPPRDEPIFAFFYEGGWLGIHRKKGNTWALSVNGEIRSEDDGDAWLAQDRVFIEAVRSGNRDMLLNDFQDGLKTLAPVLAGRSSAYHDGAVIDVDSFMAEP